MSEIKKLDNYQVPTPEQIHQMKETLIENAKARNRCIGKVNEGDFFSGAMVVMYMIGIEMPPEWVMNIFAGNSLIE